MDIGELLPIASGVLTSLATQIVTAAPSWTLRWLRGSKENEALVKVVADSLGQAFLDARCTDAVDADWLLAVAREWEPAFTPAVCARLLSMLRGDDAGAAFQHEAVRALEDAGADLIELGQLLDVAEFLHVLPRQMFSGLRSAALMPDSGLRDLVDALLRQDPVTAAEVTLREASPREFGADLIELLIAIEARAAQGNMPRYTPPGATTDGLTRSFRVRRGMRGEHRRMGSRPQATDPDELVMEGEQLSILDWAEVTSHDDRVILLGDPGMGKSWLIRWETVRLARAAIDAIRSGTNPATVIIPVPIRCDELIASSGASVAEAVFGFLLARYPVPRRSQQRLGALIESGNMMMLLDALDELPDKAARRRLDEMLGTWISNLGSRFRVASRIAGYSSVPAPAGTVSVYELQPFTPDAVSRLIDAWQLSADLAARVREYAGTNATAGVTRIPLLIALVCAAARADEELPHFTAGIYERVLRSFLAHENRWPQVPESDDSAIDQLFGILAPLAFHFASRPEGWADQMLGAQVMTVIRSLGPLFAEAGGDAAAILRSLSVQSGLLVPVDTPRSGRNLSYQFLHRSIAEYLVAWHLATLPRTEWLEMVRDHLFFDPEWQPVISMLGATFALQRRPGEAAFMLEFLLDQGDDPFDRALLTAARVTAELPDHDFLPPGLIDRLAMRLAWLVDEGPSAQAGEELLSQYLTRLPWPVTERLLARLETSGSPRYPRILANSRDPRVIARLIALLDDDARAGTVYSALNGQECDEFIEALLSRFNEPQRQSAAVGVLRSCADAPNVAETMARALGGPNRIPALDVLKESHDAQLTGLWRSLADDDNSRVRLMALEWLAERAPADAAEVLRARTNDPDPLVQVAALDGLLQSDSTALDVILEFARRPSRYARARAARALAGHPGSAAASAALIELADDPDLPVRYWAAVSLGSHPSDDAAAVLLRLLDDDKCAPQALEALKSHDRPAVSARIIAWVADGPEVERFLAAAGALSVMSSPDTTHFLIDQTTDPAERVRVTAVQALAGRDTPAAVSALIARLKDGSSLVRQAAATALAPLSDRPAVTAALLAQLADEDPEVNAAIVRALPLSDRYPDVVSRLLSLLANSVGSWRSAIAGKLDGSSSVIALRWIGEAADLQQSPGLADASGAIEHLADRAFRALTLEEREKVLRRMAVLSLRRQPTAGADLSATGTEPMKATEGAKGASSGWSLPGLGKYVSPDLVSDEFLETEIVILLDGTNLFGDRVYSYIQLLGRGLKEMFRKMQAGANFKPVEFGTVLAAGKGEVPPDIREIMKELYDMIDVPTPRPRAAGFTSIYLEEERSPDAATSAAASNLGADPGGTENSVILLLGNGPQGQRVYVYLQLPRSAVGDVRARLRSGESFSPTDFGTVLRSGQGEPPPAVHQNMKERFGRIDTVAEETADREQDFAARLTDPARRALALADESAKAQGHGHIGTAHILLGVIREGGGAAVRVLKSLGVSLEIASRQAEEMSMSSAVPPASGDGDPSAAQATTSATLGDTLTLLADQAPAATGLLRLLAFLAPDPVPSALLLSGQQTVTGAAPETAAAIEPLRDNPVATVDAITALERYGLVTVTRDGLVLVQPSVRAAIRTQLATEVADTWAHAAASLTEQALPTEPWLPVTWPTYAVLAPHVRAVLDLTSNGMINLGEYLGASGDYAAARDLLQLIVDARAHDAGYGPEHRDTLTARQGLARWTGEAGNPTAARDQLTALLPAQTRALGPEDPDVLTTRHELARWTGRAGNAAAARDQYLILHSAEKRLNGSEHIDVLTTRANVARWTGEAGDAAAAQDQLADLLPIEERILGAENPSVLITRYELARWTGHAGDAAAARDQLIALLPVQEQILGPDHPRTVATQDELERWVAQASASTTAPRVSDKTRQRTNW